MKLLVPFGTRPEIVKIAPIVRELRARGADVHTVATGQHYDAALTDAFFDQLDLQPDERWTLPREAGPRMGALLVRAHERIAASRPDAVILVGDTNTVPAFTLAARQNGVAVAHVEAGLRSFNERSHEEVNRRIAAAAASLHFAPTHLAAWMLRSEGVRDERIHVVGNPICDALRDRGVAPRPWSDRVGVVVTAHRATNVDDPERLRALCDIVHALAVEHGQVHFPVHPRTAARLDQFGLRARLGHPAITLLPPLGYADMLDLVGGACLVVTDSGGLQEEAAWLRVPVIVLRTSTPRWEGVFADMAALVGLDFDRALREARRLAAPWEQERVAALPCPYGDGFSSARIADVVLDGDAQHLRLREPELCPPLHA